MGLTDDAERARALDAKVRLGGMNAGALQPVHFTCLGGLFDHWGPAKPCVLLQSFEIRERGALYLRCACSIWRSYEEETGLVVDLRRRVDTNVHYAGGYGYVAPSEGELAWATLIADHDGAALVQELNKGAAPWVVMTNSGSGASSFYGYMRPEP